MEIQLKTSQSLDWLSFLELYVTLYECVLNDFESSWIMVIYTIGDPSFLADVFNAVAMLTGQNDYFVALKIAAAIGVLYFFTAGVLKNEFPKLQNLLIGWIFVSAFIVPKTTVEIQGIMDRSVHAVANVPFGVALPANLLSTISYYLTDAFETAFQPVEASQSLTKGGFIDPLKALVSVRQVALSGNPVLYQALNSGDVNIDFMRSATSYITRCTIPALNNGKGITETGLKTNSLDEAAALRDTITGGAVQISVDGVKTIETCQTAHTKLVAYLNAAVQTPQFKEAMAAQLNPNKSSGLGGYDAMAKAESAVTIIAGTHFSAFEFVRASIWQSALEKAMKDNAMSNYDMANAIMIDSAIQKRNTEWSAMGGEFVKQIPAFATIVEGLVYSTISMVGFLMAVGAQTLSLVGKYFGLLVWLGFWMPVMAVTNMFAWHVASSSYNKYMSGMSKDQLLSYSGLETISQSLESAIATGSYMFALTPVLAMFFAYGSSQVLSALSGRMVAGGMEGKIDTSAVAPTAVSNSAYSQGSNMNYDSTRGSYAAGMPENSPKLNFGKDLSEQAARMEKEAFQSQQTASVESSKSFDTARGKDETFGTDGSVTKGFSNTDSKSLKAAFGAVNSMDSTKSLSNDEKVAFNAKVASNLQAGLSVGDALNASINSTTGIDKTKARSEALAHVQKTGASENSSLSKDEQTMLSEKIDSTLKTSSGEKWSVGAKTSDGRSLKDVQAEARSKSDEASQSVALAKKVGSGAQVEGIVLANMMSKLGPEQRQKMRDQFGGATPLETVNRMLSSETGEKELMDMYAKKSGYDIGNIKAYSKDGLGDGIGNGATNAVNAAGVRASGVKAQQVAMGAAGEAQGRIDVNNPETIYDAGRNMVHDANQVGINNVNSANGENDAKIKAKKNMVNAKVNAVMNDPEFRKELEEAGGQTSTEQMGAVKSVLNWAADSDVTATVAVTAIVGSAISNLIGLLPAKHAMKVLGKAGYLLDKSGAGTSEKSREIRDALEKLKQNERGETTAPRQTIEQKAEAEVLGDNYLVRTDDN